MTDADFEFIAKLLKEQSGLIVTKDKGYLLESRLLPVARSNSFVTLEDLFIALRSKSPALINQVVEAMTTNESFFFRDVKPFDQFQSIVLPYLIKTKAKTKSIRIWSAACSSGQEAYSLCMLLKEKSAELSGWNIEIVATDISTDILNKAMSGVYSQFEVQRGLPIQLLIKYFKKDGDNWNLDKSIIEMVQFKKWNLLDDFAPLGRFDVVFCRNVLIYFDQVTKGVILEKVRGLLPKDGFLYLGGAETVLGICDKFRPIVGQRGIYVTNTPESAAIDALANEKLNPNGALTNKTTVPAQTPVQSAAGHSSAPLQAKPMSPTGTVSSASLSTPAKPMTTIQPIRPITPTTVQPTTQVKPVSAFNQTTTPASSFAPRPTNPTTGASTPSGQANHTNVGQTTTNNSINQVLQNISNREANTGAGKPLEADKNVSKGLADAMASLQKIINRQPTPTSTPTSNSTPPVNHTTGTGSVTRPATPTQPTASGNTTPKVASPAPNNNQSVLSIFEALKQKQEALREVSQSIKSSNNSDNANKKNE